MDLICVECGEPIAYAGKGRPPKRHPECRPECRPATRKRSERATEQLLALYLGAGAKPGEAAELAGVPVTDDQTIRRLARAARKKHPEMVDLSAPGLLQLAQRNMAALLIEMGESIRGDGEQRVAMIGSALKSVAGVAQLLGGGDSPVYAPLTVVIRGTDPP